MVIHHTQLMLLSDAHRRMVRGGVTVLSEITYKMANNNYSYFHRFFMYKRRM